MKSRRWNLIGKHRTLKESLTNSFITSRLMFSTREDKYFICMKKKKRNFRSNRREKKICLDIELVELVFFLKHRSERADLSRAFRDPWVHITILTSIREYRVCVIFFWKWKNSKKLFLNEILIFDLDQNNNPQTLCTRPNYNYTPNCYHFHRLFLTFHPILKKQQISRYYENQRTNFKNSSILP